MTQQSIESFKVHLSEKDICEMNDAYAEALLEGDACEEDAEGVYVWFSVTSEVVTESPKPEPSSFAVGLAVGAAAWGVMLMAYCVARWVLTSGVGLKVR